MNKNHRNGGKFTGHTTLNEASFPVVDMLEAAGDVNRISIGIIERTKSSGNGVTIVSCRDTGSALEVKVRGNRYVQTFYVYTNNVVAVEALLAEQFPRPVKRAKKRGRNR